MNTKNKKHPNPGQLCSASCLLYPFKKKGLTFSVSRSFTVGNGVLVDILWGSQAAQRCSGLGRADTARRGASVPFSTSPDSGRLLAQHCAHRWTPADASDFLLRFLCSPFRWTSVRQERRKKKRETDRAEGGRGGGGGGGGIGQEDASVWTALRSSSKNLPPGRMENPSFSSHTHIPFVCPPFKSQENN